MDQEAILGNQHCGKHDKIWDANNPCPGCETEKAAASNLLGPDDTLAEQRGTLPKKSSRKTAAEE